MYINSWGMYNKTGQCASKCVFMLTISYAQAETSAIAGRYGYDHPDAN
jgi:hypothetical protein